MPIRVANLRLGLDESETALESLIAAALRVERTDLAGWRMLRKSLDARNKADLHFVCTVEARTREDESRVVELARRTARPAAQVELFEEPPFTVPPPGSRPLAHPPVVIGSGPAGLLAAWLLAEEGYAPLVLERGPPVSRRIRDVRAFDEGGPLDPESNYLFGEGGAGTFSDGKLTCRSSGPDVRRVLELFAACKGKPSILYDYRPHLGSNRLPAVVKAIRQRIERRGGTFRFHCRVEDLDFRDGQVRGVATSSGPLAAEVVVLATGHSARDTFGMLVRRGVPMVPKPFQMGVRIEQPQESANRAQYGHARWEEKLGAADYSLVARGPHDLFTFCMCAGGHVIPSVSEAGFFCTNGMSYSDRASPFANSGLMITVSPEHFRGTDVLAGMRLQQHVEQRAFALGQETYACPVQRAEDFRDRKSTLKLPPSSYTRGRLVLADVASLVPLVVAEALHHGLPVMDHRWRGRFLRDATLVAPEARGSSPVRLLRDEINREAPGITGLYPVGEGAGYAGGIVSAAVDGLRSAKAIIARYARPTA